MNEAGFDHWVSPNTDATNESGFAGLSGGGRVYDGSFYGIGGDGYWWSSTEYNTTFAWYRILNFDYGFVLRGYYVFKGSGLSVRCLRD